MGIVIDWFLTWWLRSGRYRRSRLSRWLFERRYLNMSLPAVTSLADIEVQLKQVKWTMDGPLHLYDSISYPQTVWAKKKDDCDGFAILATKLLQQWQPDTRPVLITAMLRPAQNSHTVCSFNAPGGSLWFFDNSSLRQGNFEKYADIVEQIKSNFKLICWDVVDPDTLRTIEFHRR